MKEEVSQYGAEIKYDTCATNTDGVTFYFKHINDNKELEITHISPSLDTGIVNIPKEVRYMDKVRRVTCIGRRAFFGCRGIFL